MTSKIFEVFDSHHHIWSDGEGIYPWVVEPILFLKSKSTAEEYLASTTVNNSSSSEKSVVTIKKSLIVQPLNHKFDHAYIFEKLKRHTDRFFGMALANPEEGIEGLRQLKEQGPNNLVGVRFNPALFPNGDLENDAASQMFCEASNLKLVVGVMCFTGIEEHTKALRKWAAKYENVKIIIDHMGFFRQPAVGAVRDTNEKSHNEERHWTSLLSLSDLPNIYVKISALFRLSGEPFPHYDLIKDKRITTLVEMFGADRLMWGSDWPYVLTGYQMGMSDFAVENLIESARIFERWNEREIVFSEEVVKKIMFQSAMKIFKAI